MASGPIVGGDDAAKEKPIHTERKVYTRKSFKGLKKDPNALNTAAPGTATAKNDSTTTAQNDNTTTAKKDETATATSKNDDTTTAKNDDTATAKNDDTTTAAATTAVTTTATPSETATGTKNYDDSDNNITVKSSDTNEPKGITNDVLAEPPAPPVALPEDGNSVQPQVSPGPEDGSSSQPPESSRLEDGSCSQPLENPIPEDGVSSQPQEKSTIEGGSSVLQQENSRLEDEISAPQQDNSRLEDENSALLQENLRLEDGDPAQLQAVSSLKDSRLEGEDLAQDQPQRSSRLEEAQPQASSRLEDEDLSQDQPQGSSRLDDENLAQPQESSRLEDEDLSQPQASSRLEDEDLTQDQPQGGSRLDGENLAQPQASSRLEDKNLALSQVESRLEGGNLGQPPVVLVSDDSCSHQQEEPPTSLNVTQNLPFGILAMERGLEDRIKISLSSKSKQERRELRWKLESELDVVRSLVKRIELKQGQAGGYGRLNMLVGDRINNPSGAKRSLSEVASAGVPRESTRPLHQLSISMLENSQGVSETVEKEKRTPKANQFYRNSEFLLAKDKFPPAESNKKSKLSLKRRGGGEMGHGLAMGSKFFKSCCSLLEKLMKHKHAWVFNAPVDVEGLGLHDYFTIITHPMDLGTVKSRLDKNWYKSPKEFAEDVRLTFHNAMTYNPKGQDVHVMAEQLSKIFEDRWAIIESDYNREMRYGIDYGAAPPVPSPLSRKVPTFPPPPLDMRILDRSESLTHTPRVMTITPSSRTPAPKKPKAKDPNKRDMTFEEKQKLSTNLQSLPSEKLDAIVQIIKKRNSALNQHDDEIEVDIDSVDAETLWELDRFVTNYKKSLSKNKRKAELAQARAEAARNAPQKSQAPVMVEVPRETKADERNVPPSLPMQGGNQAGNGSRSSSSSSSSSDSGSSSSDSDSDSSSASGSDAGSQGT